jgi:hypothetical protein
VFDLALRRSTAKLGTSSAVARQLQSRPVKGYGAVEAGIAALTVPHTLHLLADAAVEGRDLDLVQVSQKARVDQFLEILDEVALLDITNGGAAVEDLMLEAVTLCNGAPPDPDHKEPLARANAVVALESPDRKGGLASVADPLVPEPNIEDLPMVKAVQPFTILGEQFTLRDVGTSSYKRNLRSAYRDAINCLGGRYVLHCAAVCKARFGTPDRVEGQWECVRRYCEKLMRSHGHRIQHIARDVDMVVAITFTPSRAELAIGEQFEFCWWSINSWLTTWRLARNKALKPKRL